MNGTKSLAPIAPSYPQSPAYKAAASYVRPAVAQAGDSDPDMDEALRRVQTNLAYIERDQQPIAAYYEWAAEVAA